MLIKYYLNNTPIRYTDAGSKTFHAGAFLKKEFLFAAILYLPVLIIGMLKKIK